MAAAELADMQSGTVVYGGIRQPRTLFRLHGTGRHWIGEHGERYTDAEAAEELGEFESERRLPTREQVYQAAQDVVYHLAVDDAVVYPLNYRERTILDAVLALLQKGA